MLYELPSSAPASAWPEGIGYICAQSEKGLHMPIPVLPGINVLTLGVVGTGKTSSYTLPAADILLKKQPETKAVFFEIKHSFIDHFMGPKDKVITHHASGFSHHQLFIPCLIKEIRQAADHEGEMRQLAEFLFAELLDGADQNRGWIEAARNAFIGVLRVIVDGYPDANTGNGTLVHALRNMTTSELLHYLAKHPRNHSLLRKDFGFDPAHPDHYQNNRRSEDIMFFFNQVLEKFSGVFEMNGEDTIHDFLHDHYGRNLFLLYDLAAAESCRPFMLYYLKKLKDEQMSAQRSAHRPMLWVMDEIDKMADGTKTADFGLFQAANLGREYGLQILLTTQSIENLYGLSKDYNAHTTIGGLAGFPMMLAFRTNDPSTVSALQTLFGSGYHRRMILPASRLDSIVIKEDREPLVSDSAFASLDIGECYVKIMSDHPRKVKILYDERKGGGYSS